MCTRGSKEGNYEFFERIENYIDKVNEAESSSSDGEFAECDDFSEEYQSSFKNKQIAKSLCEQLIKIYKSLNNSGTTPKCSNNNKNGCGFFNYWVNFKISKDMINRRNCINEIYDGFESQCPNAFGVPLDADIIYNINKDDLHKMNLLYSLYKKYKDIDGILDNSTEETKRLLLSYSTACCTEYLEANYMCNDSNDNNNSQFCTQLNEFKTKYENLHKRVEGKDPEYYKNFIKLTECNNNTVSTALIGTTVGLVPLLVGLYKFTPLRQLINSKNGKLTQEYRNTDDEIRNIMLMDQGNEHISSQQETYNIKYHSV
ncbi:PIR protein [Plasmodium vivax]|uniref:VIR protein n=1 Tax=Plasmodium vivax TaxID=5855 RepID=A0A565A688_PLAVI|nr:PIR protein [Plasmodium vivax]